MPSPQFDVDLNDVKELPEHVARQKPAAFVAEAAWLERRVAEDRKRSDRIEETTRPATWIPDDIAGHHRQGARTRENEMKPPKRVAVTSSVLALGAT